MSEKERDPSRARESGGRSSSKGGTLGVSCGMEDCDAVGQIRFLGDAPYEGFKFDTPGWTVVEDAEDHRTVFLCGGCAKELEEAGPADGEDDELDEDDDEETDASSP